MILKKFRVGKEKLNNLVIAEEALRTVCGEDCWDEPHFGTWRKTRSSSFSDFSMASYKHQQLSKGKANSCFISLQAKGFGRQRGADLTTTKTKKNLWRKRTPAK